MWRYFLGRTHVALGRSKTAVAIALKLRNQSEMILGRFLGEGDRRELNGEKNLIELLGPCSRTFVDVGAHVGDWAELFLHTGGERKLGILIEPSQSSYSKLKKTFSSKREIHVINAAASDEEGEADFHDEEGRGESSSLVGSWSSTESVVTRVHVTTVDREVAKAGWSSVDVLKIDTEGYDFRVIQGAEALLREKAVGIVQFEYNAPWARAGSTLAAATAYLEGYGYRVFLIRTTGLHPLNYAKWGEYYRYSNFVAVSPRMLSLVSPLIRSEL
jgi:FkbM family methyltransferase